LLRLRTAGSFSKAELSAPSPVLLAWPALAKSPAPEIARHTGKSVAPVRGPRRKGSHFKDHILLHANGHSGLALSRSSDRDLDFHRLGNGTQTFSLS
jgi:hypothetical protein